MKLCGKLLKNLICLNFVLSFTANIFAYNPPAQGENMNLYLNANQMTSGFSVAGGPLLNINPSSVLVNPALGAYQNRITLDFGYSGIITCDKDNPYSQAISTGILVPTKWCNLSGEIFGIFSDSERIHWGNSINLKMTASKEIAENFSVGIGLGTGYLWGMDNDWNLVCDLGAVYKWGELGPMKNFRIGASVLNIGKVYNDNYAVGINGVNDKSQWTTFPGFLTMKAGAAAEFINHENFVLGLSFDVSSPCFQNLIFDAGVKIKIIDCINISSGWQFDVQACANEVQTWVPSIGISVKFNLDTGFTNKEKWQTSELEVSTAWKNIYDNVNAFSVGAIVNVGQPDVAAPTISIDADVEIEE